MTLLDAFLTLIITALVFYRVGFYVGTGRVARALAGMPSGSQRVRHWMRTRPSRSTLSARLEDLEAAAIKAKEDEKDESKPTTLKEMLSAKAGQGQYL